MPVFLLALLLSKLMSKVEKSSIIFYVVLAIVAATVCLSIGLGCYYQAGTAERVSEGLIPNSDALENAVVYDRVVIFGIDGMGAMYKDMDSPNFDRIFASGSISYNMISQLPTISAQNWTSMLHGVNAQSHGITNEIAYTFKFTNKKYPSIFKLAEKKYPDAKYLSICSWSPINKGIVEYDDKIIKFDLPKDGTDDIHYEADRKCVEKFKELFVEVNPKITFVHLDNVDENAHKYGYGDEYNNALKYCDELIGEMYDFLDEKGLVHSTLFICVSDHGHKYPVGGHGGESEAEKLCTLAVNGDLGNIIKGTPGKAVTHDIASIVLYALGIKQPANFDGRVPYNIFNTL